MKRTLLILLSSLFIFSGCADYANAEPKIGYGIGVGGAATNSDGSGVYGATTIENGEVGGMIAVDSGFLKI